MSDNRLRWGIYKAMMERDEGSPELRNKLEAKLGITPQPAPKQWPNGHPYSCTCDECEAIAADKPSATGSGEPRRDGHSALRVNNGKLETFDPHPTPPASQPIEPPAEMVTLSWAVWNNMKEAWATRSVDYEHECVTLDFGTAEQLDALLRSEVRAAQTSEGR
jgi:hypothetical protein